MHYVDKGRERDQRGKPASATYLVCSTATKAGRGCQYRSWRYPQTEAIILEGVLEVDYRQLHPAVYEAATKALATLDARRLTLEDTLAKTEDALNALLDSLESGGRDSKAIRERIEKREATRDATKGDLRRSLGPSRTQRLNVAVPGSGTTWKSQRRWKRGRRSREPPGTTLPCSSHGPAWRHCYGGPSRG